MFQYGITLKSMYIQSTLKVLEQHDKQKQQREKCTLNVHNLSLPLKSFQEEPFHPWDIWPLCL